MQREWSTFRKKRNAVFPEPIHAQKVKEFIPWEKNGKTFTGSP